MKELSNAVRALSMDAVEQANSGHPGMPMGMADVATVLYTKFLKFDPNNPTWPDRDRFVLSAGHGSMLLYALLYLTGYKDITIEQIKNFRQLHSLCAGHPEINQAAGIEMTTGPLGQGISTAVGMALAERMMNARFDDSLVDHHTYTIASDGDLMEGISHEACSLAGHLKLNKLIVLYDDNGICIDGSTNTSFSDNTPKRFESYGWDVQTVDGHDFAAIEAAIEKAQNTKTPSLICCKTHIGFGAPTKQGKSSSHGSPLGKDELEGAKKALGWTAAPFDVPDHILNSWRNYGQNGTLSFSTWTDTHAKHAKRKEFDTYLNNGFDIAKAVQTVKQQAANEPKKLATRQASGAVLEELVKVAPNMIGGSADLTGSNNTITKDSSPILSKDNYAGQYIHYGVREHGMAAIMNGMALHGGFIPYSGTFLVFSDYCRPSIRLAALMKQQVIHVMTHDSIGLGEDGPTHQPVEHLSSLRAMPNTYTFRPCDLTESAECWELALNKKDAPSIMSLTRQGLTPLRTDYTEKNLSAFGAYILEECEAETPDITLFASGSEVELIAEAAEELSDYNVRVVSVPCMDLFWEQDQSYIDNILGNNSIKIAVEAAGRQSWDRILGYDGQFIGMNSFGESAPAPDLYKHFGITTDNIVKTAKERLKQITTNKQNGRE
jgi:transketolase